MCGAAWRDYPCGFSCYTLCGSSYCPWLFLWVLFPALCGILILSWLPLRVLFPALCGILLLCSWLPLHCPWLESLESSYPNWNPLTWWNPLILSLVSPVDPLILSMVVPGYPCGFCFRPCNGSQNGSHFMLALPADSSPMMRMSGSDVPRAPEVVLLKLPIALACAT